MNPHLINDHWLITFLCRSNLNNNTWVINNFFPDFWVKIFKNIDGIHYGKNAMIFVIWCDKIIMFIYNPFNIKLVDICFLEEVLLLFMLFITLGNMSVLPLTEIFYTTNGNQRADYMEIFSPVWKFNSVYRVHVLDVSNWNFNQG